MEEENKNKKPKHFLILKIVGAIFICIGIIGAILSFTNFSNFDNDYFIIGGFMCTFGFFVGLSCTIFGFSPEFNKLAIKSKKYIQEENKEDLTDISSTTADITGEAVTKTAKAVKKGIKDSKYCKHCGAEIDADSKYCKDCGGEQ